MAGCGCGSGGKKATPRTYYVIGADGKIVKPEGGEATGYSSEMEAFMASSQLPGSKVRPG